MSVPYDNEPKQVHEAAAIRAQQRAAFSKDFSHYPLGCASDVDFHASLESARLFAEGTGPFSAIQEWIKASPEVEAMIAVGTAFGPWFTAAGFLYGLYSDWQRKKQDKETAEKIIREQTDAREVDAMINRAVESVEKFIKDEQMKEKLDSLKGLQRTLADLMTLSADTDFANIDTVLVGSLVKDCNQLLSFFERIFNESIEASDSAQAAVMYGHIVDGILLKNQTLAWQDKTLPHGTSSLAMQGVLELQKLHEVLLPAVRKTTDKQFSGMESHRVELDSDGHVIRPHSGPKLEDVERIDLFFYFFRGEVQGGQTFLGTAGSPFVGIPEADELGKEMEKRKEEEYSKVVESLRAMGEEHKAALNGLGVLIKEESNSG
ncbi:hypothetical protein N7471_010653 [Penicillium samsonianum]|uniref:uncharacterized protein n=1 Tax=Penicillium samsonianum TaxID=1882272 RepID=UPI002547AD25|nr:uncharacterized protein N7471_010653 [Penicillium samsonianum]KAJ6126160.1 hypothetical protein N7471_010653 [Penicillium samsonianum]